MRHLVTGGSGFLGSLIARRLAARGESVAVLDLWDDPARPAGVDFFRGDILDRVAVARAMRGVDVVHHNAALVPITKSGERFREVNVAGSRVVAEEAARAKARAFAYMSSSAVYGIPARCPVRAEDPAVPVEAYGASKLEGEREVQRACAASGLPVTIVRPRTIIAPGRLGIFQILFEWIREGRRVYILGSGNKRLQFVHADDLMDAYWLALERGKPGVYNVGCDRFGTLRQTLEGLIAFAGSRSRVVSLPARPAAAALKALDVLGVSPLAPYHYLTYDKDVHLDVTPLLELGWKPRYSQDEMLRQAYRAFLERPEQSGESPHRKPLKQGLLRLLKKLS